ncbi:flagellar hook-length control protein FliK [Tistrella mobilis]|uniref:flagellar hook-length control protein FliK n=1 Tax=Tistrella mobilis TaxID=171437 RepID=UPI00355729F3
MSAVAPASLTELLSGLIGRSTGSAGGTAASATAQLSDDSAAVFQALLAARVAGTPEAAAGMREPGQPGSTDRPAGGSTATTTSATAIPAPAGRTAGVAIDDAPDTRPSAGAAQAVPVPAAPAATEAPASLLAADRTVASRQPAASQAPLAQDTAAERTRTAPQAPESAGTTTEPPRHSTNPAVSPRQDLPMPAIAAVAGKLSAIGAGAWTETAAETETTAKTRAVAETDAVTDTGTAVNAETAEETEAGGETATGITADTAPEAAPPILGRDLAARAVTAAAAVIDTARIRMDSAPAVPHAAGGSARVDTAPAPRDTATDGDAEATTAALFAGSQPTTTLAGAFTPPSGPVTAPATAAAPMTLTPDEVVVAGVAQPSTAAPAMPDIPGADQTVTVTVPGAISFEEAVSAALDNPPVGDDTVLAVTMPAGREGVANTRTRQHATSGRAVETAGGDPTGRMDLPVGLARPAGRTVAFTGYTDTAAVPAGHNGAIEAAPATPARAADTGETGAPRRPATAAVTEAAMVTTTAADGTRQVEITRDTGNLRPTASTASPPVIGADATPVADRPAVDRPTTGRSMVDAPTVDAPAADVPMTGAPKTAASTKDAPVADGASPRGGAAFEQRGLADARPGARPQVDMPAQPAAVVQTVKTSDARPSAATPATTEVFPAGRTGAAAEATPAPQTAPAPQAASAAEAGPAGQVAPAGPAPERAIMGADTVQAAPTAGTAGQAAEGRSGTDAPAAPVRQTAMAAATATGPAAETAAPAGNARTEGQNLPPRQDLSAARTDMPAVAAVGSPDAAPLTDDAVQPSNIRQTGEAGARQTAADMASAPRAAAAEPAREATTSRAQAQIQALPAGAAAISAMTWFDEAGQTAVTGGDPAAVMGLSETGTTRSGWSPQATAASASAPSLPMQDALPGKPAMQVAQHMHTALTSGTPLTGGESHFVMTLMPADLGRVRVEMKIDAQGRISARFSAEKPEAVDALAADARDLERSLTQAGFRIEPGSLRYDVDRSLAGQAGGQQMAGQQGQQGQGFGGQGFAGQGSGGMAGDGDRRGNGAPRRDRDTNTDRDPLAGIGSLNGLAADQVAMIDGRRVDMRI